MADHTSADSNAPEFLDKIFLKNALEKGLHKTNIDIVDFKVSAGSNPGDNYTSMIYRVNVIFNDTQIQTNGISLIIKSIVIDNRRKMFESSGIVEKEIKVYAQLLPRLHDMLKPVVVAPKCFDILSQQHVIFVFEDMKALGYKIADRVVGLDEDHLKIILVKIAKFHAASMKLLKDDPSVESHYRNGFFFERSLKNPVLEAVFRNNLKIAANLLVQIPAYQRFSSKLMKLYEHFHEIILKTIKLNPADDIKVINHGDLWVNNFLFKYGEETNKPEDAVFVDYQGTCCNSLGLDLNYLFATSAQLDTLKQKLELVRKYYYPSFSSTLKGFGFTAIPSIEDVIKQMKLRGMYYLINFFAIMPLISINREESKTNNFEQFTDKKESERKILVGMSSTRFLETMKYSLDLFEELIDGTIRDLNME